MGFSRGYIPDWVDRCPICNNKGFGDYQVQQIDQYGSAQCPSCSGTVTREMLRRFWNEMERQEGKKR